VPRTTALLVPAEADRLKTRRFIPACRRTNLSPFSQSKSATLPLIPPIRNRFDGANRRSSEANQIGGSRNSRMVLANGTDSRRPLRTSDRDAARTH